MAGNLDILQGAAFYVTKVNNLNTLQECYNNKIWACNSRKIPPQPKDILQEAFDRGPVILVFSVNNCHGWHGYARMKNKPGSVTFNQAKGITEERGGLKGQDTESNQNVNQNEMDDWHRFEIEWVQNYADIGGEKCLPFSKTDDFFLPDGTPLNKARNFQAIDWETGTHLCRVMDKHLEELLEDRRQKMAEIEAKRSPAFFKADKKRESAPEIWARLMEKVESMGTVLLACAFGSQRYNLHTAESDTDMFIVYAAPTKDVLGLKQIQPTIKNRDVDNTCDYTVHEVHRYCELLVAGDPRCVETLYLHPSAVYTAAPSWRRLESHARAFLTRGCCEKYLRDAEGGKGLRLMEKWAKSADTITDPMEPKMAKLFYIIIRLLQNAREVADGEQLQVYREDGSPERELLMAAKTGRLSYDHLMAEVKRLQSEIRTSLQSRPAASDEEDHVRAVVEDWLLQLRYEDLKQHMEHYKTSI